MNYFEIIAGLASTSSLVFAAVVYHRKKVAQATEKGNIRVFREKLKNIEATLRATGTNLQILIRRADNADVTVSELQNIARTARSTVYSALVEAAEFGMTLKDWKFGELLETRPGPGLEGNKFEAPVEDLGDAACNEVGNN